MESAESTFAAVRIVLRSDGTVGSVEAGFGVSEIFPVKAGAISTDFSFTGHRFTPTVIKEATSTVIRPAYNGVNPNKDFEGRLTIFLEGRFFSNSILFDKFEIKLSEVLITGKFFIDFIVNLIASTSSLASGFSFIYVSNACLSDKLNSFSKYAEMASSNW